MVEQQTYAAGSKSERRATMIVTASGDRYLLRGSGVNAYDAVLETLDGASSMSPGGSTATSS
jgi:hypothetical protein